MRINPGVLVAVFTTLVGVHIQGMCGPVISQQSYRVLATGSSWGKSIERSIQEDSRLQDNNDGTFSGIARVNGTPFSYVHDVMGKNRTIKSIPAVEIKLESYDRLKQGFLTISTYCVVPDNNGPLLYVKIERYGKSWLFINKIQVMADGVLILDRGIDPAARDTYPNGRVEEISSTQMTPEDITSLRKISEAKKVIIKVSGTRGEQIVDKHFSSKLQEDLRQTLNAISHIEKSLE